jgi:3-oxoadipate enol-lactonase
LATRSEGFVDVGTARLYLETWGTAGATTLLALHGLGGGTHFFGALGVHLASLCRSVAFDLPGSGLSPPLCAADALDAAHRAPPDVAAAPAFSIDAVADLAVSVARSSYARGRALYLLGHSMGTIIALEAIRRAPDLATGLIVVGGLPEPLPEARRRLRDRVALIRRGGMVAVTNDVVAANFSERSRIERPELGACFSKLFAWQDAEAYAVTASALATWTARDLPPLDRVTCLAITGEEDRYAPPDEVRAFARALPPSTRVEIMRDCGHLPFLEQPATFAAIVSAFLRERDDYE